MALCVQVFQRFDIILVKLNNFNVCFVFALLFAVFVDDYQRKTEDLETPVPRSFDFTHPDAVDALSGGVLLGPVAYHFDLSPVAHHHINRPQAATYLQAV